MSQNNGAGSGSSWSNKSAIERALLVGIHGAPVTRAEERARFLGELAERVLAALTPEKVGQLIVDRAVAEAAADSRAVAIIAHGDLPFDQTRKYRQLAEEHGLTFTARSDPSYTGEIGLVVVSDQAVTP